MPAALEERRLQFPGLLIQMEPKRYYPDSAVAAHLLGYVGEIAETERVQERFASVRLGAIVGKDGLERQYDEALRGQDGVRFVEVNALGRMIREGGVSPALAPVAGAPLWTTVDIALQRYVAEVFKHGTRIRRRFRVQHVSFFDGGFLEVCKIVGDACLKFHARDIKLTRNWIGNLLEPFESGVHSAQRITSGIEFLS